MPEARAEPASYGHGQPAVARVVIADNLPVSQKRIPAMSSKTLQRGFTHCEPCAVVLWHADERGS